MAENLKYYEIGRKPPKEALKPISGGRMNGKTDINPMWRIKVLTEMFGPVGIGWYYKSVSKWIEQNGNEVAAFVDIEMFVCVDGKWSMPISGTGGSMFVAKEKSGPFVSDECYKMATTDAISVCCKQLGIGADIYWDSDKTKYDQQAKTVEQSIDQAHIDVLTEIVLKKGLNVKTSFPKGIENLTDAQYQQAVKQLSTLKDKEIKTNE